MAIDGREFRNLMGTFATGVTVVTTHDTRGNDFGLTANAICSVSLDPPLLLLCVDRGAESYPALVRSGVFVVNVLARAQENLSRRFAVSGGSKFDGVALHAGETGAAILEGALAFLECRVVTTHEAGDHTIFVGGVAAGRASGGPPLLFFRGEYGALRQT